MELDIDTTFAATGEDHPIFAGHPIKRAGWRPFRLTVAVTWMDDDPEQQQKVQTSVNAAARMINVIEAEQHWIRLVQMATASDLTFEPKHQTMDQFLDLLPARASLPPEFNTMIVGPTAFCIALGTSTTWNAKQIELPIRSLTHVGNIAKYRVILNAYQTKHVALVGHVPEPAHRNTALVPVGDDGVELGVTENFADQWRSIRFMEP